MARISVGLHHQFQPLPFGVWLAIGEALCVPVLLLILRLLRIA